MAEPDIDALPWWARQEFWRKAAIWVTAGMFIVLIVLTLDTHRSIVEGGVRVPAYTVIDRHIDYRYDPAQSRRRPFIGGEQLLFGERHTPEQAADLVRHGKLVIQSRNCMNCHTLLGNGAYYAPDLTKAWLDRGWGTEVAREGMMLRFLQSPGEYARGFGTGRRMPDLGLTEAEARAVIAYLKWMSAIDTSGFPYGFHTIVRERTGADGS